jgi:hypothetical protein
VRLSDGKLLTAGSINSSDSFGLLLLNPDGKKVESFGDEGWVGTQFGKYQDGALAMALQPDGKVVVVGSGGVNEEDILDADFALARYK